MTDDNEHIHVEFHSRARAIFFSYVQRFEWNGADVNRQRDEYQFQLLKDRYINTLKQDLEQCASQLLQENQNNRRLKELDLQLQYLIKDYLHLFVLKTRM